MAEIAEPPQGFSRIVIDRLGDCTLLQSVCDYCGFRIVGSITETLQQDEAIKRAPQRDCA